MIKRNRYRKIPPNPNRKKRGRRSVPLERSVHIDGKRWGWEYFANYDDGVWENERIKIVSPDNKYYEVMVDDANDYFNEDFPVNDFTNADWRANDLGKMISELPETTITLRSIKPSMVKRYIKDKLIGT